MLTGKTIGQLTLLETPTSNTLIPVELDEQTYHIVFSSITTFFEVTYSELYDKITGVTLSSGSYYKITDYKTCYDQPNFDYNKNRITDGNYKNDAPVEPIIVFATSSNTISDQAYQPNYPNDRIRYDWTFNQTEITQGEAFGRISERIDEYNNRTDYDHRRVQFRRYRYYENQLNNPYDGTVNVVSNTSTEMSVSGTGTSFEVLSVGNRVSFGGSFDFKVYTITNIVSDTEMTITGLTSNDGSNLKMYSTDWDEYSSYYQNNVDDPSEFEEYYTFQGTDNFNNYIGNHANLYDWEENDFLLANNVFHDGFIGNKFGDSCYNNTFFDDCHDNNIGNHFYNNITDDDFDGNVIGNYYYNNRITSNFQYNRIGENFYNNYIVQNSFYRNNIMNDFRDNEISGGDFQNNEIGNQFNNNVIKEQFYKNDIGNGFYQNNIYWGANGNLIGNGFNQNDIYCAFYDNVIGEYFEDNTLGDILNPSSNEFYENRIGVRFESNTITNDFYKNDIGPFFNNNDISGETYTNRIGEQFENNTIYGDFYDNQIFNEFKGNMTYQDFNINKVDWGFGANQFSGSCGGNVFGSFTTNNDFLGLVFGNVIKGDFNNNTIGDVFVTNNIGFGFSNNTIGEGFGYGAGEPQGNIIGDGFADNTIGEYFYNNSIPNNFHDNETGNYFQWNVINTNIDNTYFTLNYGNITGFSYTSTGTTAGDMSWVGLSGTTNGNGVGAEFNIITSGGVVTEVLVDYSGNSYSIGDTITILGTQIGGTTPEDDVVITVTDVTAGYLFYEHYTKQIFERKLGNKRVSYYDENDILNIDSVYEASGYIPVYSQSLTFPINYTSVEFWCNGSYTNELGYTGNQTNSTQDVANLFNNNFRQYGYFFDNNDGTIGLYINPSLKQQYCPSGTYTINVFND